MVDDNFDKRKIIQALRDKGVPDSDIMKLYGPLPPKPRIKAATPPPAPGTDEFVGPTKPDKPVKKKIKRFVWTKQANEKLKSLFAAGYDVKDIASEFGVTKDVITGKITRFKNEGWDGLPDSLPLPEAKTNTRRQPGVIKRELRAGTARAIENSFGVLGRMFNKKVGLHQESIGGGGGGNAEVIEALDKSNQAVIGSLSKLNTSLRRSSSVLTRSIAVTSSKIVDRVDTTANLVRKLTSPSGSIPTGGASNVSGGGSKLGKTMLGGSLGILGGLAFGATKSHASLSQDPNGGLSREDMQPTPTPSLEPSTMTDSERKLRNDGEASPSEDKSAEIKSRELTFKADEMIFEADAFKFANKNASGGSAGSGGGVSSGGTAGSEGSASQGGPDASGGATGSPGAATGTPPVGGGTTTPDTPQPITGGQSTVQDYSNPTGTTPGGGVPNDFGSKDFLAEGRQKVSDGSAVGVPDMANPSGSLDYGNPGQGISKENVPDWAATATYKAPLASMPSAPNTAPQATQTATGPVSSKTLADQRAAFAAQLAANPALKEKMGALMLAEEGGKDAKSRMALAESAMNRANTKGIKDLDKIIDPNYYAPFKNGSYDKNLGLLRSNDALRSKVFKDLDAVTAGSNHSNLATDNASAQVKANALRRGDTLAYEGENKEGFFRKDVNPGQHGAGVVRATQDWYRRTTEQMRLEKSDGTLQPPESPNTSQSIVPPTEEGKNNSRSETKPSSDKQSSLNDEGFNTAELLPTMGPNAFRDQDFPMSEHGIGA